MNKIIIASAGTGKTTNIMKNSLEHQQERILIITYTINNFNEIKKKFYELNGSIPKNVEVQTLFTFLLDNFVRPYQNNLCDKRIDSIEFVHGRSATYIKKDKMSYYLNSAGEIYSDKMSEFGILCNEKSNNPVIKRL